MCNMKALSLMANKSCQKTTKLAGRQPSLSSSKDLSFSKEGQTSRSRSQSQKLLYQVKGLVTRNAHVQYESSITSDKKVMAKVKVFQKKVKLQGQGHQVKNYSTITKVLSQGIHMCNMNALSLMAKKLWPRLKIFKSRSNFKVKVTKSKITVPSERSCHKEYTCAI